MHVFFVILAILFIFAALFFGFVFICSLDHHDIKSAVLGFVLLVLFVLLYFSVTRYDIRIYPTSDTIHILSSGRCYDCSEVLQYNGGCSCVIDNVKYYFPSGTFIYNEDGECLICGGDFND